MSTRELDQAKSEAFAERMIGMLIDAALALMTSIGHRMGLFDVMAGLPPSTSQQIADAANLDERYVREWLAPWSSAGSARTTRRTGLTTFPKSTLRG
jgi:hypothetical protein